MTAVRSISWDSASFFPWPGMGGQSWLAPPARKSRCWEQGWGWRAQGRRRELELLPGEEPGEKEGRESREGCPLLMAPGPSPTCRRAAATPTCVMPCRAALCPSPQTCSSRNARPDSAVVALSEENPESSATSGSGAAVPDGASQAGSMASEPRTGVPGPLWLLSPTLTH